MLDFNQVKADTQGKWPGIFSSFGIVVGDGKHTACPICGPGSNSHRFRCDDLDGKGTWICTHCGAGDGFKLIMDVLRIDFKTACEDIAKIVGTVEASKSQPEQSVSPEKLREIFKGSKPIKQGDPVVDYLRGRGLSNFPKTLRYAPKCWESETKKDQEAMLAVFSLTDGEAVTIHRTYIKDGKKLNIESPKKTMPPIKKMTGGAVRLYEYTEGTLGIAEGIETAIAVREMHLIPVWATLTAGLMETFEPPIEIKRVEIYADLDDSYTGQRAAYILANRLVVKNKIPVFVKISENCDFLEDLINDPPG